MSNWPESLKLFLRPSTESGRESNVTLSYFYRNPQIQITFQVAIEEEAEWGVFS